MAEKMIRVLLTKAEQDSHDRGVRYIATTLREAGYEVIYTNFLYPEEIVNTAIQEDVNVLGVSSSTLGHMSVVQHVQNGLKKEGRDDILVILGGIIPDDDMAPLEELGVKGIFGPGSSPKSIIQFIEQNVRNVNEAG